MKPKMMGLGGILLIFLLMGCGFVHPVQLSSTPPSEASPGVTANLQRNIESTAPLSSTGQITMRDSILNLDLDRLIADCPADSAPYAFAESSYHFVQICSAEYDPWLPKYYLGHNKADGNELWLTNEHDDTARQLIFENGEYTYILKRDFGSTETNAYLEVHHPDGHIEAEALLYLYERSDRPAL